MKYVMGALRHRITEYIRKAQALGMLPEQIVLTDETFKRLLDDELIQRLIRKGNHPAMAVSNAIGLPFELGERDEVVGKGFLPARCSNCDRPIFNPRVRINDIARIIRYLERFGRQKMICTCGHSFMLDVEEKRLEIDMEGVSTMTKCPRCGGEIKFLSSTEAFCLRCGWDNLKPLEIKDGRRKRIPR
jgi:hypothetical protein